ncbi:MAG: hypothetical protein GXN93_01570 [Candidatus Diapherotrites archaeon]|nr:hypothetical protein [Candidatus Diapherotrites archaeon]
MRRGFNLFSIFVGITMIAIAMGFAVYAYQSQQHRLELIAPRSFAYQTSAVADFVRDDAMATLTVRMRRELQNFFATQILTPPPDTWNNLATFNEWFQNDLAQSKTFTSWFAHRLAFELQTYQNIQIGDYAISIDADEKQMATAISHGSKFIILPDGTFAYVLDTEDLSPSDYAALPKVVLTKGFQQSEFPIFPRKKWSVYVPLRIDKAYLVAKNAREAVLANIDQYKLAIGACQKDCPMCAVYDMQGITPERIYPSPDKVKSCFLSTEKYLPGDKKKEPIQLGSVQHTCTNQYLDLNWAKTVLNVPDWVVNTTIPCFTGEKSNQYHIDEKAFALYNILEYRLAQQAQRLGKNVRIDLDPASFQTYKTMRVCSQTAISLSAFVSSQMPGMDWILKKIGSATGMDLLAKGIIGLTPCQKEGYLSCSAPTNFTIVVTWTDPDLNYSVENSPATYHFRINLSKPFSGIAAELKGIQDEVNQLQPIKEEKPIKVQKDQAQKLDKSCVNRLLADCMAQYYAAYADCNATPDVNADMQSALQSYYKSNPKNPIWDVCRFPKWPETPAPCKKLFEISAAEIPTAWSLPILLPEEQDWKNSAITNAYFSEFVPKVQEYAHDENTLIAKGKITDKACTMAIQGLLATFAEKGYCADWNTMRHACLAVSMNGKTMYPACPASKDTAYSTFWLHIFSEPVGTCAYGKESLAGT